MNNELKERISRRSDDIDYDCDSMLNWMLEASVAMSIPATDGDRLLSTLLSMGSAKRMAAISILRKQWNDLADTRLHYDYAMIAAMRNSLDRALRRIRRLLKADRVEAILHHDGDGLWPLIEAEYDPAVIRQNLILWKNEANALIRKLDLIGAYL